MSSHHARLRTRHGWPLDPTHNQSRPGRFPAPACKNRAVVATTVLLILRRRHNQEAASTVTLSVTPVPPPRGRHGATADPHLRGSQDIHGDLVQPARLKVTSARCTWVCRGCACLHQCRGCPGHGARIPWSKPRTDIGRAAMTALIQRTQDAALAEAPRTFALGEQLAPPIDNRAVVSLRMWTPPRFGIVGLSRDQCGDQIHRIARRFWPRVFHAGAAHDVLRPHRFDTTGMASGR